MAAASSSPNLCAAIVGVFVAKNDVGLGTVVGACAFDITCLLACVSFFSGGDLQLDWRPVARDTFYLMVVLVVLLGTVAFNGKIDWEQSLGLLVLTGDTWLLCLSRTATPSSPSSSRPTEQ